MANRSTFTPENNYTPDTFRELFDLSPSQIEQARRYQLLKMKANKTPEEIEEYNQLLVSLQDHLITPERWNHFQDALVNMQLYIRNEVFDHVDRMQQQTEDFVESKKTEIDTYVDGQLETMQETTDNYVGYVNQQRDNVYNAMNESINTMENRRDGFTLYVNMKQDEVRGIVQDFDSRTIRYYQTWTAKDGQVIYNIFAGEISGLPSEARLMLDADDIDVIVQGTILKPYVDYDIYENGNYDSIELKGNAASLITAGTEIFAKWYKNAGKLYFKHASTHELGGTDEIRNLQIEQLHPELQDKIRRGSVNISTLQPKEGLWFKVIG